MKEISPPSLLSFFSSTKKIDKKITYKRLAYASLSIVLGFILLQFGLFVSKEFLSKRLKSKMSRWNFPLMGFEDPNMLAKVPLKMPRPTLKKMLSVQWQKDFELWFDRNIPFRTRIVRMHNQIYAQIFLKSYMHIGHLVLGKNQHMYEKLYVEKYYNLPRINYRQETFDDWADDLQALANFFRKRGQQFIYVITPSKAAFYPEYLPTCRRCKATPKRPDYYMAISTLKKRGFNFVDGSRIVLNQKNTEDGPYLFPRGGSHYTLLGAAWVTQQIMKEISKTYPLPELQYSYKIHNNPEGVDRELVDLANLRWPDNHYPVPSLLVKPLSRSGKPLKLAMVGCSFDFDILKILAETRLFDQMDLFYYTVLNHYRHTKSKDINLQRTPGLRMPFEMLGLDLAKPNAYEDLLNADIVIFEENEQNLRSNHFKSLMDIVVKKRKGTY